jgi:hypothetical protein
MFIYIPLFILNIDLLILIIVESFFYTMQVLKDIICMLKSANIQGINLGIIKVKWDKEGIVC